MRFLTQHLCPVNLPRHLCLALLATSVLLLAVWPSHAQPTTPPRVLRPLKLGESVEARLAKGEVHYYELTLEKGQHVQLTAAHFDCQVNLSLLNLQDQTLANDGPHINFGTKNISFVTEQSGPYIVWVGSNICSESSGRYRLTASIPATITPQFLGCANAQKLYQELAILYGRQYTDPSQDLFQRTVERGQEVLALWQACRDVGWEMQTYWLIGDTYKDLGEYQTALEYLQQGLRLARQINHPAKIAEFLNSIGQTYLYSSDYRSALAAYEEALPLWEQSLGGTPQSLVAWNLNNIGTVQNLMGEKQAALAYHQQAYQMYKEYPKSEDARKESERGMGIAVNNIGAVYLSLGEKQKAIDCHREAYAHFLASGDVMVMPFALNRLGEAYVSLGEPRTALEYFQQALTQMQKSNDPQALANVQNNLGRAQAALGEYEKATHSITQSLALRRRLGDRRGQALCLTNLGSVKTAQEQHQAALEYYLTALPLWRAVGDRYGEAYCLNYLGLTYYTLGDRQQANDYFAQALQLRRTVNDREGEANTLYHLARLDRDQQQLASARTRVEAALALTESVRTSVFSQELRASYLATVRDYYEFYVELLMQQHERAPAAGFAAQALAAAEKAKARSMLETLVEAGGDIRAGISPELLAQEHTLQQQLNAKAEYQIRLQNGKPSPEQLQAIAQELQTLTAEYQEVRARIRATSPRYAALTQPQPVTTQDIQQQLLDENTLLLEYALGEERSWLWVVSPTSLKTFALPGRAEIEQTAQRFYRLLTARNQLAPHETAAQRRSRVQQADAEFARTATELSRMILGPAAAELGQKRLLLVTQGALQYVPFAALPEPRTAQPLILHHELTSLPSASILALLRRDETRRQPTPKTIAVFADPVFASTDDRVQATRTKQLRNAIPSNPASQEAGAAASNPLLRALEDLQPEGSSATVRISRLSGTRWEAEKIGALVPPAQKLMALDFHASRDLALSGALSQYRIVHFASHAFINTVHPELSGIVLSLVDKEGNPQNGFLRANEIYNLKLPADLVVLSACQTGLGKDVKGEGLIGLTQSFMYAGAPRLIVSLWALQDKATADLMARFYQHLLGPKKLAPAAALRAAQVEMWRLKRWPSPYFWAGFVLQGEYR